MRISIFSIVASATFLLLSSVVSGQQAGSTLFTPGQSVPNVSGEVFGWSAGQANSTSAFWESFDGFPGGTSPGFLPAGISPGANVSFEGSATALTFESSQSLPSSGNAYGGLFGPGDSSSFVTDAFATVNSGTSGGVFTRIVAQFKTLGSELNYDSILLSSDVSTEGSIAPDLSIETDRLSLGGQFGGELVSTLFIWDLSTSQDSFRFDFGADVNNVSIDEFRIDSFTQSTAFITPVAVPEPGAISLLAMATSGLLCMRRRRNA